MGGPCDSVVVIRVGHLDAPRLKGMGCAPELPGPLSTNRNDP